MPGTKITRFRMDATNRDSLVIDTAPNEWTRTLNAMPRRGAYQSALADSAAFAAGPTGGRQLIYAPDATANYWLAVDQTAIYVTDQTSWKTITPTTWSALGNNIWTSGRLNGIPFANNGTDPPVEWGFDFAGPTVMSALTDWASLAAGTACKSLRAFRNFLIALNITDSAGEYPDTLYWSDRATTKGALPSLWLPANTNEAGNTTLAGSSGGADGAGIVDGMEGPGQGFTIYKANSAWYLQEVGLPAVLGARKLFDNVGALSLNCIQNWPGGGQIVITQGDVVIHNGREAQSIIDGSNRRWLFDRIEDDEQERCYTVLDPYHKELWVCFRETVTGNAARVALVWDGRVWGQRDLPSNVTTYSLDGYYDIRPGYLDGDKRPVLLGATPGASTQANRVVEIGATTGDFTQPFLCEKLGIQFVPGEAATVKRLRPLGDAIEGSAFSLDVLVKVRRHPKDTYTTVQSADYGDAEDGWLTVPATGYEHGFTFFTNASRYYRLTGFEVEWEPAGRFAA